MLYLYNEQNTVEIHVVLLIYNTRTCNKEDLVKKIIV